MKKTKNLKRALLVITFFNLVVFSEAQMLWQDTRYGMTVDEVKTLYPHALDITDHEIIADDGTFHPVVDLLIIEQYEIADYLFDITFIFNTEKKTLCTVELECDSARIRHNGHALYYRLYDEFTQKYGKAAKDERTRSERQEDYWTVGTWETTWYSNNTEVSIHYTYSQDYGAMYPMWIHYYAISSEERKYFG